MKKITVTAIALSMAMAMTGCSGNSTETTAASEAETQPPRLLLLRHLPLKPPLPKRLPLRPERFLS